MCRQRDAREIRKDSIARGSGLLHRQFREDVFFRYNQAEFLADFTRRFARPPADATPAWRPVPRDLAGAARARAVEVFQRLNALDPAAVAAEELTPEAVLRASACYAPRDRGERPQRVNTSLRSTPIAPLEVGDFVRPSVLLQGGIGVTDQDDLLEIIRQKASDRTGLLVLVHVTELMR